MINLKFILISSIFLSSLSFVYAQPQRGEIFRIGDSEPPQYCAAVLTSKFRYSMAEQEYNNWCWAACIEMVLHYQGLDISQTQIVQKAYGSIVNRPANCNMTTSTADGWHLNSNRIRARNISLSNINAKYVIDALSEKYPLIIGLNMPGQDVGHAYVLTAVYFKVINNRPVPSEVTLRDPWGPNPDTLTINWSDFMNRINCAVYVTF